MGEQEQGLCNVNNCKENYGICKICPGEEEHDLNLKDEKAPVADFQCSAGLSNPLAYVGLGCGRQYLKVAGVIVAVEGDICRDPMIPEEYRHQKQEHRLTWMPEMLEYAAKAINEKVG